MKEKTKNKINKELKDKITKSKTPNIENVKSFNRYHPVWEAYETVRNNVVRVKRKAARMIKLAFRLRS